MMVIYNKDNATFRFLVNKSRVFKSELRFEFYFKNGVSEIQNK